MPAGTSWPSYLKMVTASMVAMLAGAEVVHRYYRPDLSIPEIPPKRGELKTELLGLKAKENQDQISQQQ
ncbi:protein BRAWNIN [Antechinus flavipes]|uniref:protein BRAWNIN n=1 Tax=Antechinus flavipes TaxID=38775 RepID=UPI002235A9AF|nr:protein BRAWNIN [Antechinus flavipes]XP_051817216.1 protein BRAWNIN [Antechinus flavipes]XP_051817217.1 protein BRAWNIN [Antechinus flavipes]XP_051817218.1 protein BRAWNIN [Antechinus flavipes]